MGEFFRGWRRKIGVMTLAMACVVAGGWVRSHFMCDAIDINSIRSKIGISSIKGQIRWFYAHSDQARVTKEGTRFFSFDLKTMTDEDDVEIKTVAVDDDVDLEMIADEDDVPEFTGEDSSLIVGDFRFMSRAELWGHYTDLVQTPGPPVLMHSIEARVPYWSIVIPLILLSAYLLLSKSRKSTQMKLTEPTENEVE